MILEGSIGDKQVEEMLVKIPKRIKKLNLIFGKIEENNVKFISDILLSLVLLEELAANFV